MKTVIRSLSTCLFGDAFFLPSLTFVNSPISFLQARQYYSVLSRTSKIFSDVCCNNYSQSACRSKTLFSILACTGNIIETRNCLGIRFGPNYWVDESIKHVKPSMLTSRYYSTNKSSKMAANVSAILKNHSALQVTKPARKKAPKISEQGKTAQIDNAVAYAMAEEINLEGLEVSLINQGLYIIGEMPQDVTNALHVRGKYNVEQRAKEIFVFRDGSVVFWCVPEIERGAFMKMLSKFSVAPYLTSLVIFEREELDFKFTSGKSGLVGDTIHLRQASTKLTTGKKDKEQDILEDEESEKEEEHNRLLEMYTFSNALSQSVKLAIWEASLSKFVTSIVSVTEDLRNGNKIKMSRKQVLMKTGELFSLRHLINLSSDLLDTPDFYWDRGKLESLYQALCNHLNIARRTRVMNEKLNHCCELTELLSTQLNDAHHTRLEVMIIVLIMVEVVFECIHYAERYIKSHDTQGDDGSNNSIKQEATG